MAYNKLTDAELERLAWLNEEIHEVGHAIGKIIRHGYDSKDPSNPFHKGNRADLERELNDVGRAICFLSQEGDIDMSNVEVEAEDLPIKMKYSHHQDADTTGK